MTSPPPSFLDILPYILAYLPYNGKENKGSIVSLMCLNREINQEFSEIFSELSESDSEYDLRQYYPVNLTTISRKGPSSWTNSDEIQGNHLLETWRLVFSKRFLRLTQSQSQYQCNSDVKLTIPVPASGVVSLHNLRILVLEVDEKNSGGSLQAMNIACFARCFCDELLKLSKVQQQLLQLLQRLVISIPHKYILTWYARLLKDQEDDEKSWCLRNEHVQALVGGEIVPRNAIHCFDLLLAKPFSEAIQLRFQSGCKHFYVRWCLRNTPTTGFANHLHNSNSNTQTNTLNYGVNQESIQTISNSNTVDNTDDTNIALAIRMEKNLWGLSTHSDREKALCEVEIGNMTPQIVLESVRRVSSSGNQCNLGGLDDQVFSPAVQWLECGRRIRQFNILMDYLKREKLIDMTCEPSDISGSESDLQVEIAVEAQTESLDSIVR